MIRSPTPASRPETGGAVRRLPFTESTSESHMAASKLMIDEADELYAVWDYLNSWVAS